MNILVCVCVCVFMCVCFNSSVSLRTPQWRHPHPPDTCLTGYNVTIIRTWHQNNLPMSPRREPGTLLTQPPELTPRFTYGFFLFFFIRFTPPLRLRLSAKQGDRCAAKQKLHLFRLQQTQTRSTWFFEGIGCHFLENTLICIHAKSSDEEIDTTLVSMQ